MTRAGRWTWAVPALTWLSGCAALDDGPLPALPTPPAAARPRPGAAPTPIARVAVEPPAAPAEVVRVKAETPAAPAAAPPPPPPPDLPPAPAPALPVTLDAVLKLAEEQNPQVALARERINQACAEQDLAAQRLLIGEVLDPPQALGPALDRPRAGPTQRIPEPLGLLAVEMH
jgi:hypothetical protein